MTASRLVFLDIDGTILDHDQRFSPRVAEAVHTARGNGHVVLICSGRSPVEISHRIHAIGFDGVISAGGGFTEFQGELVASHTLSEDAVQQLIEFYSRHEVEFTLQAFENVYPSAGLFDRIRPILHARAGGDTEAERADLARLADRFSRSGAAPLTGIAKSTFFGVEATTYATVRDGLGDRFHVITGTVPYLGEAGGEVTYPGIDKGASIVELAERLGVPLERTIAIGDGSNDIEMLGVAGVGIAMGNADAAVKAAADEITASVDDGGVYAAFARHGLV